MSREFIQELRGDVRKEAIDIYDHIDKKELGELFGSYTAAGHLNDCGRAFQVREVCADFEELHGSKDYKHKSVSSPIFD